MKNINEEVNKIKHLFNFKKGDTKKVLTEGTKMFSCEECIKDKLGEEYSHLYDGVERILSNELLDDDKIINDIDDLFLNMYPTYHPDYDNAIGFSIAVGASLLECRDYCEEIGRHTRPPKYREDIPPMH